MASSRSTSPSPSSREPLLHDDDTPPSPSTSKAPTPKAHPHVFRVVTICLIAVLILEVADFMQRAPFTRVLEDIVCRAHFAAKSSTASRRWEPEIPEEDCKIAPVQARLAMLRAWDVTFSSLPAVFLAVPYGALADKVGRRFVLFLALMGILLCLGWQFIVVYFHNFFDVRWFWAGNAFFVLGGGSSMAVCIVFTIIADVVPEDKRAAVFFQIQSAVLLATIIGVPLAAYMMEKSSIWWPMIVGQGLILSGAILILFLPETLHVPGTEVTSSDSYDSLPGYSDANIENDERILLPLADPEPDTLRAESLSLSRKGLRGILRRIEDSRFVFSTPSLTILALTFFVGQLDIVMLQQLFQLASERFHWKLAESSFLMPLYAVSNFVVLIGVLPGIYYLFSKYLDISSITKDLIVTRGSIIFLSVGALGIALSNVPALLFLASLFLTLGTGFNPTLRSLLTSLFPPTHTSRLYAVLAVINTIGNLVAAPALGKAYSYGLSLGGLWGGLGFAVASAAYALVAVGVWSVKVRAWKDPERERETETETERLG
ncbi:major facilitator superfamily domain-containing protein [Halenospora varia]|nr:major facilitator superfamily domain-containing protein [Halenospora varia]